MSASRSTDRPRSLAVRVRHQPDPLQLVAAVVHRQVALAARLGPLHWPTDSAREQHRQYLFGGELQLGPERPADIRRHHAQVLLRDAEDRREQEPYHVRDLGGRPERDLVAHLLADHRARFHRFRDQPLLAVGPLHHYWRLAERLVEIAVGQDPLIGLVPRLVHLRRALGQRGLHVQDGRQRLVVDVDPLQAVRCGVPVACDHAGHDLAHVADLIGGHRRVRRDDDVRGHRPGTRQAALLVGEVGTGEGGDDAGRAPGAGHVDRPDPRVRHRAAQERDVHHAGQHDVVGPVGLPGDQPRVFLAGPRLADLGGDRHDDAPSAAARSTARTMFW